MAGRRRVVLSVPGTLGRTEVVDILLCYCLVWVGSVCWGEEGVLEARSLLCKTRVGGIVAKRALVMSCNEKTS